VAYVLEPFSHSRRILDATEIVQKLGIQYQNELQPERAQLKLFPSWRYSKYPRSCRDPDYCHAIHNFESCPGAEEQDSFGSICGCANLVSVATSVGCACKYGCFPSITNPCLGLATFFGTGIGCYFGQIVSGWALFASSRAIYLHLKNRDLTSEEVQDWKDSRHQLPLPPEPYWTFTGNDRYPHLVFHRLNCKQVR
jgi:hypothetical protein